MYSPSHRNEDQYLDLLRDVLDNGTPSDDRTGVGTIRVFGRQIRFDLRESFPAVTTKELAWKGVVSELLWFIEGSGDERRLAEIRYGKPRAELVDKKTIWTQNANSPYWKPKALFDGDCGAPYGVQWRYWQTPSERYPDGQVIIKETDQLINLIEGIKRDPSGRRHIISAWNPGELDNMALPPCHVMAQFVVHDNRLSCMMTQRSVDVFLGLPFNIASYALFTMMIAQICDLEVGELIISMGDVHVYKNHIEQVKLQLSRQAYLPPKVVLDPTVMDITAFTMDSFQLVDYQHHPAIKADMAV